MKATDDGFWKLPPKKRTEILGKQFFDETFVETVKEHKDLFYSFFRAGNNYGFDNGYSHGWNECLKEIQKLNKRNKKNKNV